MENVRKYRDIRKVFRKVKKLCGIRTKIAYYKVFPRNLSAIEKKKTQILMSKPVYLGFSMLDLSKTTMSKFWYDYIKPKYCEKAKLYYMDTDHLIVQVKIDDIYKDIAEDVETEFDTSNYGMDRLLSIRKIDQ